MTDPDFRRALAAEGFTVREIEKDGNCLFSAIARAMFGETDAELVRFVRNEITCYMTSDLPHYEQVQIHADYEQEILAAARAGQWGSAIHILLASELYQRNFVVFAWNPVTGSTYRTRIPEEQIYEETSFLSYHNNNHYNYLEQRRPGNLQGDHNIDEVEEDELNCDTGGQRNCSSDDIQMTGDNLIFDIGDIKDMMDDEEIEESFIPSQSACKSLSSENRMGTDDECDLDFEEIDNSSSKRGDSLSHEDSEYECDDYSNEDDEDDDDLDNESRVHSDDDFGYNFIEKKASECGRHYVYIIILIPKQFKKETLIDSIKNVKRRADLYFTVSYIDDIVDSMKSDISINKMFDVWIAKKLFPLKNYVSTIKNWHFQMMIPYLLLTTVTFHSLNERFSFLFFPGTRCLINVFIQELWGIHRDLIIEDMSIIMDNQHGVFCEKCTFECPSRTKPWHLNLDHFNLNNQCPTQNTFIFTRMNGIKNGLHHQNVQVSTTVFQLNEIYRSLATQEEKLSRAYEIFDNQVDPSSEYHSYLFLIVDGPNMTPGINFKDIEHDKSFVKALYAGQTRQGRCRLEHFEKENKGPIQFILSSTSNVYLIRSKPFSSRLEATSDEGIVLEILKLTIETAKQNSREVPFILLNQYSGPGAFFNTTSDIKKKIRSFCKAETPIFTGSRCDNINEATENFFTGHYYVGDPLDVPKSNKPFSLDLYSQFIT